MPYFITGASGIKVKNTRILYCSGVKSQSVWKASLDLKKREKHKLINDSLVFYYFAFPLGLMILMVVFLNRKEIQSLFWFGLVWGSGFTTLIIFLIDNVFKLAKYQHTYPFTIARLPLFFNLAWTPAIIMYLHFLPKKKIGYAYYSYIIIFCLLNAANDEVFHQIGLFKYIHWHPLYRFLLSLPYFYGLAVYYGNLEARGVFKENG
jgi:hypothetical protein